MRAEKDAQSESRLVATRSWQNAGEVDHQRASQQRTNDEQNKPTIDGTLERWRRGWPGAVLGWAVAKKGHIVTKMQFKDARERCWLVKACEEHSLVHHTKSTPSSITRRALPHPPHEMRAIHQKAHSPQMCATYSLERLGQKNAIAKIATPPPNQRPLLTSRLHISIPTAHHHLQGGPKTSH